MGRLIKPYESGYITKVLPLVYDDTLTHLETLARLINKFNELANVINSLSDDILGKSKEYTDEKIRETYSRIDEAVSEIYSVKNELNKQYDVFVKGTDALMQNMRKDIDEMDKWLHDAIIGVNARTDLAIEQNNEYIFSELGKSLSKIKVVNYFTGLQVPIQEMFNYLALLHTANALTYDSLINKGITYEALANANITYTNLALNGAMLI